VAQDAAQQAPADPGALRAQAAADRLAPGGYLHCATDWEPYAEQMLEVLAQEPLLRNTAAGYAPRPDYRPLTKFENRGLKLGHGVWDVVFERA
jgi:tRNA (guanine-N7-)-methyltransferase